jgi:serine protease Do
MFAVLTRWFAAESLARLILATALTASAAMAQQAQAPLPEISAEARRQYEQARDSVAQIRVLLGSSNTHASTGTGFVVGDGLFITNYHVVADKALQPEVYRLEFVLPDGTRGPLEIVAIDVVHDLAVVAGKTSARPLRFSAGPPSKGDRGFSLGYPLSQGLTVVEGTYNGRSEEQYYERIHFTGAINAGMSGGPVLDSRGQVFGINVAVHRGGQLVSFLVPQAFATTLLGRATRESARNPDLRRAAGEQLRAHGENLMTTLLRGALAVQDLGEFTLPSRAGDFMQCGANTQRDPDRLYTSDTYQCYTVSSLYIDPRLYTGMVSFRHLILRNNGLGAFRFAHLQESRFQPHSHAPDFERKHHTRYECSDEIVSLNGVRAKMAMCVRGYKHFDGLYDVEIKIAVLGDEARAMHSELEMLGVPFNLALEFSRRYLEALRWNR